MGKMPVLRRSVYGLGLYPRGCRDGGPARLPADRAAQTGEILLDVFEPLQIVLYLLVLLALVKPLGWYMARVYEGRPVGLDRVVGPLERGIYRAARIVPEREMTW